VQHLGRLLLPATLAIGLLGITTTPVQAADTLRILITGDSVTQGFHGDYTWRYRFDKELKRQGVQADLVGTRHTPYIKPGWTSAQYADPAFDSDHFARGGSELREQAASINAEVTNQNPDIIVLAAGVNDLRHNFTPTEVDGHLRDWINQVRLAKATVRIVVSPVLDAIDQTRPWLGDRIREYNTLAAATVAELSLPTSPITMADTTRGWSVLDHTAENLHPNPTGETLIAQRIAEHFHDTLGILPQQPDIYRPTAWDRVARVKVVLKDQRAVLTWDHQALTWGKVWIRRVGQLGKVSAANFYSGTGSTSTLVPRATYEFRVQFVRGRMVTPFGPISRLTVPASPRPAAVSKVTVTASRIRWTRSTMATSYVVKFRRAHAKRWITRRTTALTITAAKARRAKVWAVNDGGRSVVRTGRR
jgi:lysophospholipase L1-like esterase